MPQVSYRHNLSHPVVNKAYSNGTHKLRGRRCMFIAIALAHRPPSAGLARLAAKFGAADRPGFDERRPLAKHDRHTDFSQRSKYPSPSSTRGTPSPDSSISPSALTLSLCGRCVSIGAWHSREAARSRSLDRPRRSRSGRLVTSPNGTVSARSPSSTARTSTSSRAAASRCARYFPELAFPRGRYVLDGEIVLFDARRPPGLRRARQRIHPAESRINMLAEQTPTRFIAFDLLASTTSRCSTCPQSERRDAARGDDRRPAVDLTPATEHPTRPSRGCRTPRA